MTRFNFCLISVSRLRLWLSEFTVRKNSGVHWGQALAKESFYT